MRNITTFRLAAPLALLLLAGCAGSGDKYPSLAIRDVERVQGEYNPVPSPDPEPIRAVASAGDLNALVAQALKASADFNATLPRARSRISAGRGQSSDSNARQIALVALADLTSIANDTATPLGDLDRLKAEAATTFAPVAEIEAARAQVLPLVEEQGRTLDSLSAELGL